MQDSNLALAIVATCAFGITDLWIKNAPTLSDLRSCPPDQSFPLKQRLLDAEQLVAGLALITGIAVWRMSGNFIPLVMMLSVIAFVFMWYHAVLAAQDV